MKLTSTLVMGLMLLLLCSCTLPVMPPPALQPPQEPIPVPPNVQPPTEERDELMDILASMTLDEKIGQLIFAGYRPDDPTHLDTLIRDYKIGGVILFKRNISDLQGLLSVTSEINGMNTGNPLPLFIGIDEEGGTVSRLPDGAIRLPDARVFGEINDPDLTYWAALALAQELRAFGINVNFAPVLDVYLPGTEFLHYRSFGTDPDLVSLHGIAFAEGLRQGKVLAVGKHFPGHGGTPVDSHGDLPTILEPISTLEARELVPFRAAITADIPALMSGHLAFPALDESGVPATRSANVMNGLLREEMGFDGLIFSDDLEMGAYLEGTSWEAAVVDSIKAGCDILIIAHSLEKQVKAIESLHAAALSGELGLEQLDAAVLRIIRAKHAIDLASEPLPMEEALTLIGREQSLAILREIERRR